LSARSAEATLLDLHDRFCAGFSERRPDVVLGTVVDTSELVVVTSEEALFRGIVELRGFLERYATGPRTYSWSWDRRDTVITDTWGCLLAVGTEIASDGTEQHLTPYRMTVVGKRTDDRWALLHVHGSSPLIEPG
jgi:hypothetical protein